MPDEMTAVVEAARQHIYGVMGWVVDPGWQYERMVTHLDSELPKLELAIRAEQAARYEALVAGARTLKRGRDLGGTILMQEGLIEVLAALAALEHEERN